MSQRLMTKVRETIRLKHYSFRTEQSYCHWIKAYIRYHGYRHPRDMKEEEVTDFLTWLAVNRDVAVSTQNLAFSSIMFLYREVLKTPLENVKALRAKPSQKLPVVLTRDEIRKIMLQLQEPVLLMVQLLYGAGLRLMELLRLRIKDVDFEHQCLVVRDGKGRKDRVTILPELLIGSLKQQISQATCYHAMDKERGHHEVWMPNALAKKYPSEATSVHWQYVFPAVKTSLDPRSGKYRRTVQELMGHKDLRTTQIYTHVLNKGGYAVKSPLSHI